MTKLSRILLIILGIPTAYFAYTLFSVYKSSYSFMLIPLGMMVAVTIVFQSQIDSWWIKKSKPKMDATLQSILEKKVIGYNKLFTTSHYQPEDHLIYTYDCDFIGQGLENIPDDLKHLITAYAFYFGKQQHKKWPGHYDRIVLYKHPFLTPTFDSQAHAVEHHLDDGVIIFSLEQLMAAIERRGQFYNVLIHGFADAFLDLYPVSSELPDKVIWERLSTIGIHQSQIAAIIGLDEINVMAVVSNAYIHDQETLEDLFPELKLHLFALINS
jgi:hypothetical protein